LIVIKKDGAEQEQIPITIDLDRVSYTREHGTLGPGQPLKSFRDLKIEYPQYHRKSMKGSFENLGKLRKPGQI